jgi:hypothetical protein
MGKKSTNASASQGDLMKVALLIVESVLIAAGFGSIMFMDAKWGKWAFRAGIAVMSLGCLGMVLTGVFL